MDNIKSRKIQLLRGIAIIGVLLVHTCPGDFAQIYLRPITNYCVGLFIFLSGYLSNKEKWNPLKRILKVGIPYLVWTLIYSLYINIKHLGDAPLYFVKGLIFANAEVGLYFIPVYIQLTLFIPLMDKLAHSKFKYLGLLVSFVEILIMRTLPAVLKIEINEYVQLLINQSCLCWFSFFYLGYLLGNGLMEIKLNNRWLIALAVLFLLLQIPEGYWLYLIGYSLPGTQNKATAVLFAIFICLLAHRYIISAREAKCKCLPVLGDYSFGIYLSHMMVLRFIWFLPFSSIFFFPINTILLLGLDFGCVFLGHKILGRFAKYFAL